MSTSPIFQGKRIVLGVTGSIAAYKAVSLLRRLTEQGADVSVVMTESAKQFVAPLTFEVLSGHPVVADLFSHHERMPHLSLSEHADLFVIAPATANTIAKCALGLADDIMSTVTLAAECPVVIIPAMDGGMWEHPALIGHVQTLRGYGVVVMDPEEGPLASGRIGRGRFPSEDHVLEVIKKAVRPAQDWQGHRFLISAGPTQEPIDAVRFISNPSSGKMGYALAEAASRRGAEVILVSGPTALQAPAGVSVVPVVTADEMYQALSARFEWATALVMAAAVSDFRPRQVLTEKLKKHDWDGAGLELERTTDILAALSARRKHQLLVGFAAESQHILENGQAKLKKKRLDMVVVNRVGGSGSAFGNETNEVMVLTKAGTNVTIPRLPKRVVADRILDELLRIKQESSLLAPEPDRISSGSSTTKRQQ